MSTRVIQRIRIAGSIGIIVLWAILGSRSKLHAQEQVKTNGGLAVTFISTDGKVSDATVLPNAWLFVGQGRSPSPFLPPGKFEATWNGMLELELRSEYAFQADLNGSLKLEVNGVTILEALEKESLTPASKPVRLNKGKNAISIHFSSAAEGEARLRLYWAPKGPGALFAPLPNPVLTYTPTAELTRGLQAHRGREMFVEFRCGKCHESNAGASAIPELQMDAPNFEGIGSRRNQGWLASWIQNPRAHRGVARMPQLFRGPGAEQDIQAVAAFLASLQTQTPIKPENFGTTEIDSGKKLFENLHCVACHQPPDARETAESKIPLSEVRQKFSPGALQQFLLKPNAHYEWIRMPNFKLSPAEALQLAAFVTSNGAHPAGVEKIVAGDAKQIEHGRKLVLTMGCLNCHVAPWKTELKTKALADLDLSHANGGCLATTVENAGKAPFYGFSDDQRAALRAFGAADSTSLARNVPSEFAQRYSRVLNCIECHGKFDGFPPFEILGGKLQPEWSRAFIAGEIAYKPRPWLDARMPAFARYAGQMAEGLAELHGYPPQTAVEPPIDQEAARIGQKLISAIGGFSCISCHSVGEFGATQVFESAGINFAYTGKRILKSYFHRWVRNPVAIDPTTKMPVYFDEEGKSPLTDIYDGDGLKQREAIWQYLRLGDKMPPPPTQ